MDYEWIGYLAAILTTSSYFPQLRKVFKEKETKNLSLGMFALVTSGLLAWCIYGIVKGDWPLIVANGLSCAMSLSIMVMKIRHG